MGILRRFETPASIKLSLSKHRLSFLVASCFVLTLATSADDFALAKRLRQSGQNKPQQGCSICNPAF